MEITKKFLNSRLNSLKTNVYTFSNRIWQLKSSKFHSLLLNIDLCKFKNVSRALYCMRRLSYITFSGIRFTKPMEKRYTHALLFGKQYLVDIYSTACGEHVKCHLYNPDVKDRISTVKSKIPGKSFLKSESRTSVTFKL